MSYYNRDYEKLQLHDMEYLCAGSCARILHNKDMIFKQYFSQTPSHLRLSVEMFDILKSVNDPHFMELFDIYSDSYIRKSSNDKLSKSAFTVDAYTAKYYPDDAVNPLLEHKNYLLDNFKELETLFKVFTENKVFADDIRRDNTIIGRDKIVIIDPDIFYTSEEAKKTISISNKWKLLKLFRSILLSYASDEKERSQAVDFVENELMNIEVKDTTDITSEISKKLKYVKKPIELLKTK